MSFGPFLGGKRVCLGKSFAETMAKVVVPNLLYHFNFKFVDENNLKTKKNNNIIVEEPVVMVKATANVGV